MKEEYEVEQGKRRGKGGRKKKKKGKEGGGERRRGEGEIKGGGEEGER